MGTGRCACTGKCLCRCRSWQRRRRAHRVQNSWNSNTMPATDCRVEPKSGSDCECSEPNCFCMRFPMMKLIMGSGDELSTRMQHSQLATSSPLMHQGARFPFSKFSLLRIHKNADSDSIIIGTCGFHHWHGHELHESRRAILVRAGAIFGRQQEWAPRLLARPLQTRQRKFYRHN